MCSNSAINDLVRKQKAALRPIHNAPYNVHTESQLKSSAILPLNYLMKKKFQFMYQFVNYRLPSSFANTWTTNAARRKKNYGPVVCYPFDFFVPFSRLFLNGKTSSYFVPRTWKEFDWIEIKITSSKSNLTDYSNIFFLENWKKTMSVNASCVHTVIYNPISSFLSSWGWLCVAA